MSGVKHPPTGNGFLHVANFEQKKIAFACDFGVETTGSTDIFEGKNQFCCPLNSSIYWVQ